MEVGDTEVEPDKATVRLPGLRVIVSASVTAQLRMAVSPSLRILSSAVKELMTGLVGVIPSQADKIVKQQDQQWNDKIKTMVFIYSFHLK